MQDSRSPKPVVDSDATSKDTLGDLEETERSSDSQNVESQVPSPDGSVDEGTDKSDAGPM